MTENKNKKIYCRMYINTRSTRIYTQISNTKPKLGHANSRLRFIYHNNMSNESGKSMMFRLIYHTNKSILQNDLTETHV